VLKSRELLNNNPIRVLLLHNPVRLNRLFQMPVSDGTNISHSIQLKSFSTPSVESRPPSRVPNVLICTTSAAYIHLDLAAHRPWGRWHPSADQFGEDLVSRSSVGCVAGCGSRTERVAAAGVAPLGVAWQFRHLLPRCVTVAQTLDRCGPARSTR
jgi:hypothetical protein